MDLVSIVVGLVIGIIIGSVVAAVLVNSRAKQKRKSLTRSEQELKAILAQQASLHIESTKESIDAIYLRLEQLTNNIQQYESSLQVGTEDTDKLSFFGEHAGVFLRNNNLTKASNDKFNVSDAPPRDFANNGSGLFVGNVAQDKSTNK